MTGAELFSELRPCFASTAAMNAAIGNEWRARDYCGLRMESAEALLAKHRSYTAGDGYDGEHAK